MFALPGFTPLGGLIMLFLDYIISYDVYLDLHSVSFSIYPKASKGIAVENTYTEKF